MEVEKAIWNEVSTDFDPEEETANFGTRHALETGGNLYEVRVVKGENTFIFLFSLIFRLKSTMSSLSTYSLSMFESLHFYLVFDMFFNLLLIHAPRLLAKFSIFTIFRSPFL